ncbi:MAG: hypothetical protein P8N63_14595, partial [Pseudomonadales bacterium]|nr:hypothetical protein [Pseudomonadales bacterium]
MIQIPIRKGNHFALLFGITLWLVSAGGDAALSVFNNGLILAGGHIPDPIMRSTSPFPAFPSTSQMISTSVKVACLGVNRIKAAKSLQAIMWLSGPKDKCIRPLLRNAPDVVYKQPFLLDDADHILGE